jgi:hypothetical protein
MTVKSFCSLFLKISDRTTVFFGLFSLSTPVGTGVLSSGVKRPRRETDHSPPPSTEVENACRYISTPPYVCMAWCLVENSYCEFFGPVPFLQLAIQLCTRDNFVFTLNLNITFPPLFLTFKWPLPKKLGNQKFCMHSCLLCLSYMRSPL